MKVTIIGAGNVGRTLGRRLAGAGHRVTYAVRNPSDDKYADLDALAIADAVQGAEVALLTTPWAAAESALAASGDFGGRVLVDVTNPIGPGFALTHGHTDSGGEQVARWAPSARVVKAFNSTGVENMADPGYGDRRAVMLLCGDEDEACATVAQLAEDIGFEPMRVGELKNARLLEPAALLWIDLALRRGQGRNFAFGVLRR